jgi:hypothetical protein
MPLPNVASSWVFGTVGSTATTAGLVLAGTVKTVSTCPPGEVDDLSLPALVIPATTTTPMTPAAANAGSHFAAGVVIQ